MMSRLIYVAFLVLKVLRVMYCFGIFCFCHLHVEWSAFALALLYFGNFSLKLSFCLILLCL